MSIHALYEPNLTRHPARSLASRGRLCGQEMSNRVLQVQQFNSMPVETVTSSKSALKKEAR